MVCTITNTLKKVKRKPVTVEKRLDLENFELVVQENQLLAHFAGFNVNFIFCKQTSNDWRTNK
jgi:hypothetical protein